MITALLGAAGIFYGIEQSAGTIGAVFLGLVYGCVGLCIGIPLALALNITRNWR